MCQHLDILSIYSIPISLFLSLYRLFASVSVVFGTKNVLVCSAKSKKKLKEICFFAYPKIIFAIININHNLSSTIVIQNNKKQIEDTKPYTQLFAGEIQ